MKRPWLTTQRGQRAAMALSYLLSLLLLVALAAQFALIENPRSNVAQLVDSQTTACVLSECQPIAELCGLEVIGYEIIEGKYNNFVRVQFRNPAQLRGTRELRLELRDSNEVWMEASKAWIVLSPKGELFVEFGMTQTIGLLESGTLRLMY